MEKNVRYDFKKLLLIVLIFFILFLIIFGIHYISSASSEDGIRQAAKNVLLSWYDTPPEIGEKILIKNSGWIYSSVFIATSKGKKNGLVFVIPISGNSGPYTGVFYYTPQNGTVFCGLAGLTGLDFSPEKYGITKRITLMWIHRIDSLVMQTGVY